MMQSILGGFFGLLALLSIGTSKGSMHVKVYTNALYQQKAVFEAGGKTYLWQGFGENNTLIGEAILEPNTQYTAKLFYSPDNGDTWLEERVFVSQKEGCTFIGGEDANDEDFNDLIISICPRK